MRAPNLSAVFMTGGVLSHLTFFIRGEHHISAPRILRVYGVTAIAILCYLYSYHGRPIHDSLSDLGYLAYDRIEVGASKIHLRIANRMGYRRESRMIMTMSAATLVLMNVTITIYQTIGWLIKHAQNTSSIEEDFNWLLGDFLAMVTGGTEPVVAAMVFLIYYLTTHPIYTRQLRGDIRQLKSYSDDAELQKLPLLNALIYETFRLHPSIPSGGLRVTPPEGLEIEGVYIPGATTVLIPQYTLHRREDCFEQADKFIPERWTTRPEMVKNHEAFMPWGHGPYACVGKNLGLMEIRIATVLLVDRFEFTLAPGEDGTALRRDTMDCFAVIPGNLNLVFTLRDTEK